MSHQLVLHIVPEMDSIQTNKQKNTRIRRILRTTYNRIG